jgi:excisionase family DNA binding protein
MLLTVAQASERLGVKPGLVYQLVATRRLRHCRIGRGRGVIRIPEDAIEEYLRSVTVEPCGALTPEKAVRRVKLRHLRL